MSEVNIMRFQVDLESNHGKPVIINKRMSTKDMKAYRELISDTLMSVGFKVIDISMTTNNLPLGVEIEPIPLPILKKKIVEPDTTDNDIEPFVSRKPLFKPVELSENTI
jgi:hypothetical protein